ncbi:MAG: IS200/IS605 family transposase [Planctomycetes bacterium]|nr:IS200/IS605 family transposase [Planctomycetota bacterium]
MAHTFSNLLYHAIFGVKHRQAILARVVRDQLFPYLAGIVQNHDGHHIEINGVEDHAHLFFSLGTKHAVADVMRDLKASSSKWLNEQRLCQGRFHWQTGYAIFSVSQSLRGNVAAYVRNQETHHAKKSFEQEYLEFLVKHGITYDPRFVFDTEFTA